MQVDEQERVELKKLFKESGIKVEVVETDTSAMGGLHWFPEGVIFTFLGLVGSGFVNAIGADIYKKVKIVLKRILIKFKYGQNVYLTFKEGEYSLYFEISRYAIESDVNVIDNIVRDYPIIVDELHRLFEIHPEKLFGSFRGVVLQYDLDEKRWIVAFLSKR